MSIKISNKKYIGYIVIALFLLIICYYFIDFKLALSLHQVVTRKWYHIGQIVSWLGDGWLYSPLLLLFVISFILQQRNTWFLFLQQMVLAFISSTIVADGLKMLCGRARPYAYFHHGNYGFYGPSLHNAFWSFPSGHVTTVTAVFISLSLTIKKTRYLCYLPILLVAIARMITFHHYLSDTIAGLFVGLSCAYVCNNFLQSRRQYNKNL